GHRVDGDRPLSDHDVPAAERREEPADQQCPRARDSPGRGDADHLDPRIVERPGERTSVIDVIADVGVDDDAQWMHGGGGRAGAVAAVGMAWTRGAKNSVARKSIPTTTLVRPVRAPTATPAALSI